MTLRLQILRKFRDVDINVMFFHDNDMLISNNVRRGGEKKTYMVNYTCMW
jgi:hypothetical protein